MSAILEPDLQCFSDEWETCKPRVYECRIWLCPEADGGHSAIAPFLPGVVSQGSTEEEAIKNIKEAFEGALSEYLESGGDIPWSADAVSEKPQDAREKWILVHV